MGRARRSLAASEVRSATPAAIAGVRHAGAALASAAGWAALLALRRVRAPSAFAASGDGSYELLPTQPAFAASGGGGYAALEGRGERNPFAAGKPAGWRAN